LVSSGTSHPGPAFQGFTAAAITVACIVLLAALGLEAASWQAAATAEAARNTMSQQKQLDANDQVKQVDADMRGLEARQGADSSGKSPSM
jgi:type II secretory pathway component PulJ